MVIYFRIKFGDSFKMCLTTPISRYRILGNYNLQLNYYATFIGYERQ
jgi:hypothetical protein